MIDLEHWLQADILSLGMAADEARRRGGTEVTYLRVHLVSLADLGDGAAIPAEAAEVRLHELPASRDEAVARVTQLRASAGSRRVAAYSMADLVDRVQQGWGRLEDVLQALVTAGLSDVAELPLDRLADPLGAVRSLAAAGVPPRRLTIDSPVSEKRQQILEAVSACRAALTGPLHYAPLPRRVPVDRPTTGYDDLRTVALARLAVSADDRSATRVEVDWRLYGPKLSQVALTFGADHLDSVPATSDASLGHRRTAVADVERNIRAAGFEPREERPGS